MSTRKNALQWLHAVVQAMAAPVVLIPLAPVIIACWIARWLRQGQEERFEWRLGDHGRPVRCPHCSGPILRATGGPTNPFAHPALAARER
jgi:hypothetical protein